MPMFIAATDFMIWRNIILQYKYAGIKYNDVANAPGISVSVYVQGCEHYCKGCFNPETWDFNGGKNFYPDDLNNIIQGLQENGIKRNLCILGGEPLHPKNIPLTFYIISHVRDAVPDTSIYIWTGYRVEELQERAKQEVFLHTILRNIDYLIDGPFIEEQKDLRLAMRGSANQRIFHLVKGEPHEQHI